MTDPIRYAPKPKLRVGQVWKNVEGREVTITDTDDDPLFPFIGSVGHSYTPSGKYWHDGRKESDRDLVELIADAPSQEWQAFYHAAAQLDPLACCLGELRDRVVALEAVGGVAGNPGHASAAPAGVSVDELADCLPANAWAGPEGYSRQAFAQHLLDHPRIGPLLRGEGAAAPKRVVLQDWPPKVSTPLYWNSFSSLHGQAWQEGHTAGWAAARAEVECQQGGQADG